jgi:two-component system sensor histidine kinase RegB
MTAVQRLRLFAGRWRRDRSPEAAGRNNMLLLVQLRWIAVAGQLAAIAIVHFGMSIVLPLPAMLMVPVAAVVLNIGSLAILRHRQRAVTNAEQFVALLFDVVALGVQLYLSGGATNPFASLFLLQVVLGAILLDRWASWAIVAVASLCSGALILDFQPLTLPDEFGANLFDIHIAGAWVALVMVAVLIVLFLTRISENLRARDAGLARLRQRAAEEDHIVRMGLLASGAAHELGTPLASLAVILNDWRRIPPATRSRQFAEEIDEMLAAVSRCKTILSGILMSAGEVRGEAPTVSTLTRFLDDIVRDWHAAHPGLALDYDAAIEDDRCIVSDPALRQVIGNVLENAYEASPGWIGVDARADGDLLVFTVTDRGPGFSPEILPEIGRPYRSTKPREGGGLGLFLVVNVMRKLGGEVYAANRETGGAVVRLTLPLTPLTIETET